MDNPNFVGRKEALEKLEESSAAPDGRLTTAIVGLGGIGKTQLAVRHAYASRGRFTLVHWLEADEQTKLESDYLELAIALGVPVDQYTTLSSGLIQDVNRALHERGPSLLIFDNVKKQGQGRVRGLLPTAGPCHTIITAQRQDWLDVANHVIRLGRMNREESIELLVRRSGKPADENAHAIAEELGDLPLALDHAAAYCDETGIDFALYLDRLETSRAQLLDLGGSHDHPDTLSATLRLSIQELDQSAADWLCLCSFYSPDEIPIGELVGKVSRATLDSLPESLAGILCDQVSMDLTIAQLRRYSLVEHYGGMQSIHRLVQAVVRDTLRHSEKTWVLRALDLLRSRFDILACTRANDPNPGPLGPHAYTIAEHILATDCFEPDVILLAALRRVMTGRFEEAVQQAARVHQNEHASAAERAVASVKLAAFYDHLDQPARALEVLEDLLDRIDNGEIDRDKGEYHWARYQSAINRRRLGQLSSADAILRDIETAGASMSMEIGARHHRGVIALELGDTRAAQELFEGCLSDREARKRTHRLAFEYRRLGQCYALSPSPTQADQYFQKALSVAREENFDRYVREIELDHAAFIRIPQHIRANPKPTLCLAELSEQFEVPTGRLADTFRVLAASGFRFTEEWDIDSATPTGRVHTSEWVNTKGICHASIAVAILNDEGEILIQTRGENESHGRFDISVAGHVEVAQSPAFTCVVETYEEVAW